MARTIHKSGHNVLFSKPSEYKLSGLQKTFSLWNARSGGLATISKQPLPIQNIPATNTDLEHSRCTHTWIPAGCGLRGFHLFNVYGYVGAGKKNPHAFQQNEDLLQQFFQSVALLGNVPWLIVGDFQTNPSESPTLGSMCSNNFAYDLGELFTDSTWTFQKGDNENIRTRIDLAICNDVMLHHVVDVEILRDSNLPGHCPIQIQLSFPLQVDTKYVYRVPKRVSHTLNIKLMMKLLFPLIPQCGINFQETLTKLKLKAMLMNHSEYGPSLQKSAAVNSWLLKIIPARVNILAVASRAELFKNHCQHLMLHHTSVPQLIDSHP